PLCPRSVHQHSGALQVARAAQARRKDEMTLEQSVGCPEFGENVVVAHHGLRRPLGRFGQRAKCRLRLRKAAPIEPRNPGAPAFAVPPLQGTLMRLIGWAIALAAAGLTPAAAQGPASTTSQNAAVTATATPPAGTAQNPNKADASTAPAVVPGTVGHMLPTVGVGEPTTGRMGIQD